MVVLVGLKVMVVVVVVVVFVVLLLRTQSSRTACTVDPKDYSPKA